MNEWVLSNFVVLFLFTLYSVSFTDYNLSHLAPSISLIVGGLVLYHFCGLLWMGALYERLDSKMVYLSAAIALVCWHFGLWSAEVGLFARLASFITGFTPPFHLLNVQAAIMYVYMTGWVVVCYKSAKKNRPDLNMLAISGGVLLAIVLGYHLIVFWSVFSPANTLITKVDGNVLPTLMNLDKSDLMAGCGLIDGVDCFRFSMEEGYPEALLNYNSNYTESIRFFAHDPMAQKASFHHSVLYRDAFFVDADAQHYSRTFFYDQTQSTVNYFISNYLSDLPVNLLSFVGWMTIGAVVFWQWIVIGIGVEHSVRLAPRSRKTPSKKELGMVAFSVLILSTALAFAEIDQLLAKKPVLMLVVAIGLGLALILMKLKKAVVFLGSVFVLSLPAAFIYISGLIKQYGTYHVDEIQQFSLIALFATIVTTAIFVGGVVCYFKEKTIHVPEVGWMLLIFVVIATVYTFIGSHVIFPKMIANSEQLRLDGLTTGNQLIEFCKVYPFDACLTVNEPEWKQAYFKPLMSSVWLMVTSGIVAFSGAFYTLVRLSHTK